MKITSTRMVTIILESQYDDDGFSIEDAYKFACGLRAWRLQKYSLRNKHSFLRKTIFKTPLATLMFQQPFRSSPASR
jgi:hypothetical protein